MRLRCALVVVASFFLQGPADGVRDVQFPPDDFEGGRVVSVRQRMQRVQPDAATEAAWAAAPGPTFTGFDARKFGFRSVRAALMREPLCDDSLEAIDLVLAFSGDSGIQYWQLFQPVPSPDTGETCIDAELDDWFVLDAKAQVSIELATPDSTIPVLRLSYAAGGGMTLPSDNRYRQLFLDLRQMPPRAAGLLERQVVDGNCLPPHEKPEATCPWNPTQSDFLCTETYGGGERHVWLLSGHWPGDVPGSRNPRDLAAFARTLAKAPHPVGRWAEPQDVGAVRLIAEVPGTHPGRRILLFGARSTFGSPFTIASVDSARVRIVRVAVPNIGRVTREVEHQGEAPFRPHGEPPKFIVQPLTATPQGLRLLGVVEQTETDRTLFHLVIDDRGPSVAGGALYVTATRLSEAEQVELLTSGGDACDPSVGGFAAPVRIQPNPLVIDYDDEPAFKIMEEGPWRDETKNCAVSTRARWQPGKGFVLTTKDGPCRADRFRVAYITKDGTVRIHTAGKQP